MRRSLPILAAAALLAGCGNDEPTTTEPERPTPATTTAATATTSDDPEAAATTETKPQQGAADGGINRVKSVPDTVEFALTAGPCLVATDRFLATAYGGAQGCKQAVRAGGVADSAQVSDVEIAGDTATAIAVPDGGPNDGERIHVTLVRPSGAWLIDELVSNVPAGP